MNSIDKFTGSCSVLFPKICALKETKDIYVKAFNMITNKIEAKPMTNHISCDCKCKFNSSICNSNQKWNNKISQCERENYCQCNKDCNWNPSTCICEKSKHLKSIADTLVNECDEIIIVINNVSTKKINTVPIKKANITSTALINCDSKNVRDCYILHTVLLLIILLLIIFITCYRYSKQNVTI